MRSRRNPGQPSWLTVVEGATAAFTGTARVVGDEPADAAQTSGRGSGYLVTASVSPGDAVFGALPDAAQTVTGETSRPPERRLDPDGPRFPPDTLRDVPFWDQARPGVDAPVLVVASDPPVVRALTGPDDDLPAAVATIRGWTDGDADVERDLEQDLEGGAPAVCYVAGFELLARTTSDLPGLAERFLRMPDRPGAAVHGIIALLGPRTGALPDDEVADLGRRLLGVLADEQDPEALVAFLGWFDAHRARLDKGVVKVLPGQAARAAGLRFDGPDGDAWTQEVARFAEPLTEGA
ncbi:hypothetical protein Cch01nite_37390 [Cellulomonas chitinilytica]|uniref:Uncharacterized protein n=1 Tax=Cellulomonas chitinilytica TaxID=398759 RepID=A0A919U0L7_9CELL|nr:hypothetical protein [Cellulomonas chitinilytica]GIG23015.1 hypothetical protein Cch01nite_37390 [Cellulomonas chitinilytica]